MASDPHPSDITPVSLTIPQDGLDPEGNYDRTLLLDSVESLSVPLPGGDSPISGERAKPPPRAMEQTAVRVDESAHTMIAAPASDAVTLDVDDEVEEVEAPAEPSRAVEMIITATSALFVFMVCFALSAAAVIAIAG